ncbi:MAG: CrcB family protein [Parvularculaceae bacterium]|nr:CrcB family protein [Parvularculaceae bacterium]
MAQVLPTILTAAAGGAIGAALRVGVVTFLVPGPWGIAMLNVLGALLLGFVLTWFEGRGALLTVFLGGGVLGALTTFSTFAGDAVRLATAQPWSAGLYVVGSVSLAVLAFVIGVQAAKVLS